MSGGKIWFAPGRSSGFGAVGAETADVRLTRSNVGAGLVAVILTR